MLGAYRDCRSSHRRANSSKRMLLSSQKPFFTSRSNSSAWWATYWGICCLRTVSGTVMVLARLIFLPSGRYPLLTVILYLRA